MIIDPKKIPTKDLHQYILAAVSPRPIAFVSTIDADGQPNLAPYSFFNAFSSNPPIVVFSSNRRVKDNTTKHTLANVEATQEVVINVVTHEIVRQMTLTSIEYGEGISEFEKAGFTPIASDLVRPFRVKESPINMECKVTNIIPLGDQGGAGNLIFCEVVRMHIDEKILDGNRINPHKLDIMGRLGRTNYARIKGDSITSIFQSVLEKGIGFDGLPKEITHSNILTGNDIAELASLPALPKIDRYQEAMKDERVLACAKMINPKAGIHLYAKELIAQSKNTYALAVLLCG